MLSIYCSLRELLKITLSLREMVRVRDVDTVNNVHRIVRDWYGS